MMAGCGGHRDRYQLISYEASYFKLFDRETGRLWKLEGSGKETPQEMWHLVADQPAQP